MNPYMDSYDNAIASYRYDELDALILCISTYSYYIFFKWYTFIA